MRIALGITLALAWLWPAPARSEDGIASHYAPGDSDQNGTTTACGPKLTVHGLTAAHRTLPCGTKVKVINRNNGRNVLVTITDRGPFARGRIIDLTIGAARALGFRGLAPVTIQRQ